MGEENRNPDFNKYRNTKSEKKTEKESEKKVEKVVTGNVKTKKKKEICKLADVFISEDIKNVKSYVLMDVLVPAIKKAISDIVRDGIDMILYGESGARKRSSGSSNYVSYRSFSERDRRDPAPRSSASYAYDDFYLDKRGDAESVLAQLDELIDRYGLATVADLNESIGRTGEYTDCKYGWMSLRNAEVIHTRDGYTIKLPKARPID